MAHGIRLYSMHTTLGPDLVHRRLVAILRVKLGVWRVERLTGDRARLALSYTGMGPSRKMNSDREAKVTPDA